MNRTYTYVITALIILALVVGGVYAYSRTHKAMAPSATTTTSYLCREGKSIDAVFGPESVILTLSDTRAVILPQVVSGSGVRYEKDGVVFIGKGDNAFLEENGTQTFVDCVVKGNAAGTGTGNGRAQFTDSAGTFSFTYPDAVSVSGGGIGYTQGWMVNATTSGLVLAKAVLSSSSQPKTNFSNATFTVGTSPDATAVSTCLTYNPTGGPAKTPSKQTINGTTYTVFTSSDAGAGNRYDTTSYRVVRNNQCYAIEYTIHSTNIGNYSPDQGIQEFDAAAVTKTLDEMVQSFQFTDGA